MTSSKQAKPEPYKIDYRVLEQIEIHKPGSGAKRLFNEIERTYMLKTSFADSSDKEVRKLLKREIERVYADITRPIIGHDIANSKVHFREETGLIDVYFQERLTPETKENSGHIPRAEFSLELEIPNQKELLARLEVDFSYVNREFLHLMKINSFLNTQNYSLVNKDKKEFFIMPPLAMGKFLEDSVRLYQLSDRKKEERASMILGESVNDSELLTHRNRMYLERMMKDIGFEL